MTDAGGPGAPVTVALVNDFEIVVEGLRRSLAPFSDRVLVVDTAVGTERTRPADIALFDTTGGQRHALSRARELVERGAVGRVVFHSQETSPGFVAAAHRLGVSDILPKEIVGEPLVAALEAIATGHHPPEAVGPVATRTSVAADVHDDEVEGLTNEEWELLALLGIGLSNEQIADELFISVPRVRRRLHRLYRRLDVPGRAAAAEQARRLGLTPRQRGATDHLYGARVAARFRRVPKEIAAARAFTRQAFADRDAPPEVVDAFVLVLSELAANVVAHGAGAKWTVGVKATSSWFVLDVSGGASDADGLVFHPERWAIADPDQQSGRGLGIVRTLMDDVDVDLWRGQVRVRCAVRQR